MTEETVHKAKVLLVDNHPIMRKGFALLIDMEPDLMACGHVGEGLRVLDMVERLSPDIVVLEIDLNGISGLDLIESIKARRPRQRILTFSRQDENFYAERALRAGASGYIMKEESCEKAMAAIRSVLANEICLSDSMLQKLLSAVVHKGESAIKSSVDSLSNRELEVFRLMGQGRLTAQIAKELHLSGKTIETHYSHIWKKLNLHGAAELRQFAICWEKGAK